MDVGQTLGGSALTGLLLALGYAGVKIFRRSRCASHTRCCDLDIARGQETERKNPMAGLEPSTVEMMVLDALQRLRQPGEPAEKKPGVLVAPQAKKENLNDEKRIDMAPSPV